jgi:hypothetical protein
MNIYNDISVIKYVVLLRRACFGFSLVFILSWTWSKTCKRQEHGPKTGEAKEISYIRDRETQLLPIGTDKKGAGISYIRDKAGSIGKTIYSQSNLAN